jgi:hypothetical protein
MPVGMITDAQLPAEFSPVEHYEILHGLVTTLLDEGLDAMRRQWARVEARASRQTTLDSHIGTAEIKTVGQMLGGD